MKDRIFIKVAKSGTLTVQVWDWWWEKGRGGEGAGRGRNQTNSQWCWNCDLWTGAAPSPGAGVLIINVIVLYYTVKVAWYRMHSFLMLTKLSLLRYDIPLYRNLWYLDSYLQINKIASFRLWLLAVLHIFVDFFTIWMTCTLYAESLFNNLYFKANMSSHTVSYEVFVLFTEVKLR